MEDPASDKMISTTVEVIQPQDEEDKSCGHNCLKQFLKVISIILIVCTFPLSLIYCVKIAREYERAVLFKLGMLRKKETVGPKAVEGLGNCADCMHIPTFLDLLCQNCEVIRKSSPF